MPYKHLEQPLATNHTVPKILSLVVAGILVLLPFHALLTTWLGSNIGHIDLVRIWKEILIIFMLPFVGWLIYRSDELRSWFRSSPILWLIRFYVLLHIVLGTYALVTDRVNTTSLTYALIINLRFVGFFIVCYVVAANYPSLKKYWRQILLWPAAFVLAFGLVQLLLPVDFLKHFGYGPETIPAYQTVDADLSYQRIQSTLRGANPLGAYLVLIILAALFIKQRYIKLANLLGGSIALFYTYSRSAWIGLLTSLSTLELWKSGLSRKSKKILLIFAGVLVVAGGVGYALRSNEVAQDTLFHTSEDSVNVSSNAQRLSAMNIGLADVVSNPLGEGPGTAGPASFRNTDYLPRISENYFLQIGQEVGIIGIILFGAINILVAKSLWRRRSEVLAQVLLASLVGITFINLVSHSWTDDTLSLIWWGLAGICLAPIYKSRLKSRPKPIKH